MKAVVLNTPEILPEDIKWWEWLRIRGETTPEDDEFLESEKIRLQKANILPYGEDFPHL